MPVVQQLDMFRTAPEWLFYLRTRPEFEEIPHEKGIPINYWRCAGLYRCYGPGKWDVGVNVGHWHEECSCEYCAIRSIPERHWYVLILFEDGKIEKFDPMSLFPAEKPDWWTVPECWTPNK